MDLKAKSKKRKRIITIVSLLLAVSIVSLLTIPNLVRAQNDRNVEQSSGETKTETVGTQDIRQVISGSGQIVTGEEEILETADEEEVDEVLVQEGQAVKKGAVLLTYTDDTEMTAPFNGVIKTISISDSTEGMNASSSDNITIMSTQTLVTELSVDETELPNLKVGQKAEVTINALSDTKYAGTVTKISETGEYSNGSSKFKIVIKLDKTDKVKIGMSAAVEIVVKSVEGAVAVPIEAVKGSGDNSSVIVVNSDGTVTPVTVELGLANDAYVQIVSGLNEGEIIQYTVVSSTSSNTGFGGFGNGNMPGQTGRMPGGNGGADRISGGNMPQAGN